jgi:YHS domain-containing protein
MKALSITLLATTLLTALGCEQMGYRPARTINEPVSVVNTDNYGIALQGYDPVAYFTDHKPVKGVITYTSTYKRATYWFANAEHKKTFDADPAKYEPQFGGYCAYAASINTISPISPDYWEIVDGRLLLQHNQKAWDLWHKDSAGSLKMADANWPGLVKQYGN